MTVVDHRGDKWNVQLNTKKVSQHKFTGDRYCAYRAVMINEDTGTLMVAWLPVFTEWF